MARQPKDLRRRVARRPERRTILVFCEGSETEPAYINALKKLPGVRSSRAITIDIDPRRGGPMELVRMAEKRIDEEIDEIWCVFDVEWPVNHPRLEEVVAQAERNGLRTAISNPCFELWLLLHESDENAFLTTDQAERKSRARDGRGGKKIDGDRYVPYREAAVRRAETLADRHIGDGKRFPRDNPSSSVSELVKTIDPACGPRRG